MVTSDGRVKIADFGIAKATTKMQTGAFLTATGTTVGTPTYMAPEQAMAQDIGPWTDLYSVGCMAFELFTGKVPFHDSDAPMAILLRHVNEPIAPVKSIDPRSTSASRTGSRRCSSRTRRSARRSRRDAWDDFEEIIIGLLGPRWRRSARLGESAGTAEAPNPLTPAPFQGTTAGAAASDEFQSFAWGQPAADTDGSAAASTPYTPPPQDLPPGPMEETPRPRRRPAPPRRHAAARARSRGALPPRRRPPRRPGRERRARRRLRLHVRAAGAAPPTDALVRRPRAPPAAEPARPPRPEPEVAVPEPAPAEPEPQAEVTEEPAPDAGFETYIAPPPPRPPTEDPGTDALQGVRRRPPSRRRPRAGRAQPEPVAPAAAAAPEPVASPSAAGAPAPEPRRRRCPSRPPEPAAAALRVRPERDGHARGAAAEAGAQEGAKPKRERKPQRPPSPRPPSRAEAGPRGREAPKSKAFPIALAAGAAIAILLGFLVGGSGGGGEEPAADTGALTGSPRPPAPREEPRADWSELGTAPDVPGLSLSDPRPPRPGKDGGLAVVVGTVEKAADNSTLLAQPFLQASATCRSRTARSRSAAATCRPTATTRSSSTASTAR